MRVCTQCGREAAEDARYCSGCGAVLAAGAAREERKVVTVLFADLVGFTARAETLDPEDVRALLAPYHARLRAELERFGGSVEKFIGDAVMALFGAPLAHEDDPERAVRAALAIRDWVAEESDLHVRIAVNTGEALVALDARPAEGEGMASGDVVNTAARLQAAAPVDGILVGEHTYRATRDTIDYREATAVEAKGKAQPIPVWQPLAARSRFGVDVVQRARAPLVGRERELDLLLDALDRTCNELTPQLVTLVGVPGIGKSRLVYELFAAVDARPDTYYWRQGRSLPYGQGLSLWALGEIVKAHAGILEDDGREQSLEKLAHAVRSVVPEAEAEWVAAHVRDLVGLAADRDAAVQRRDEAFAAWSRFLEGVADVQPLILVFEDLHWADDTLLDFVDYLVEWASGVALLVVCLARPELLERRPGWGGGKLNALTLALSPLADEDAARVIAAVLEQAVLPAETQLTLLARAGGNPLYAEQYAHLFLERGSADDLPLPETVQGIIAARVDALPAAEKAVLQDAAVLGKVFWAGALGGHERIDALLHSLERKEFVRRERRPSIAGETELSFRHVLVRDVAYSQIPRAARIAKHEHAASWIESLGREEDHAELVAHHCLQSLELARAAGRDDPTLARRAAEAARLAGERAMSMNAYGAATDYFGQALELTPADDPSRPRLLLALGVAWFTPLADSPGAEALEEAAEALFAAADYEGAAEAERLLFRRDWFRGHTASARAHLDRALELVGDAPESRTTAAVLAEAARHATIARSSTEGLRMGREALAVSERLGYDDVRAAVLTTIGLARTTEGDWDGLQDLEQGLELAKAISRPGLQINVANNLAEVSYRRGDVARGRALWEEALLTAERFGIRSGTRWCRANLLEVAFRAGDWDEAAADAGAFLQASERAPYYLDPSVLRVRAQIALARGDREGALADGERALALARDAGDAQLLEPALFLFAFVLFHAGRRREARELVDELLLDGSRFWPDAPPEASWLLRELGRTAAPIGLVNAPRTPWIEALEAALEADWARAAAIYAALPQPPAEAFCRLRAAAALIADGARAEGGAELERALAFYRSVGATVYLREGEALLAATA